MPAAATARRWSKPAPGAADRRLPRLPQRHAAARPVTGAVLGYEAQYLGKAELVRGEAVQSSRPAAAAEATIVPATIDIVRAATRCASATACCPSRRASW
jgi:hypothetical protein